MPWPRTKKPRSSALPGTHERSGAQVAPAPDADPARARGHNMGVTGTRHSVVDTPVFNTPLASARPARNRDPRMRYADSGPDTFDPTATLDETAGVIYE